MNAVHLSNFSREAFFVAAAERSLRQLLRIALRLKWTAWMLSLVACRWSWSG